MSTKEDFKLLISALLLAGCTAKKVIEAKDHLPKEVQVPIEKMTRLEPRSPELIWR